MDSSSQELKRAAFDGDLDRVRSLVELGADVNAVDQHGSGTLLTFHASVIEYLLSQGADPEVQTNEFGASVLAGLSYVNRVECVRVLLEHGADPDRGRPESLETPLHHALAGVTEEEDRSELVQLLVDHGADVNARTRPGIGSFNHWALNTRGETPLHRAAAWGSLGVLRILLAAGADRTIPDAHGETPAHWAGWHRRPREFIDLLGPHTS
jgi:uncharacterized protein